MSWLRSHKSPESQPENRKPIKIESQSHKIDRVIILQYLGKYDMMSAKLQYQQQGDEIHDFR